jgi:hypothetical protein
MSYRWCTRTKLVHQSRKHFGQTELLDEQGRIFGRVNIIDALVVLFASAVIVAGVALVFGGGGTDDPPAQTPIPTLELDGTETENGFRFGGNPVRLGDGLTLADDTLRTGTRVTERDTNERFETDTTDVTLASAVRTPVAEAVEYGDRQQAGDSTVATVTSIDRTAVNETHSDLEVTLALETRTVDGTPHPGGSAGTVGSDARFRNR